jgi:hypothetical protein
MYFSTRVSDFQVDKGKIGGGSFPATRCDREWQTAGPTELHNRAQNQASKNFTPASHRYRTSHQQSIGQKKNGKKSSAELERRTRQEEGNGC